MIVYDLETYPNIFTCCAIADDGSGLTTWEISDRRDDGPQLRAWLEVLIHHRVEMVGFNNLGFDYPIIHKLLRNEAPWTAGGAYQVAQQIIKGDRFTHSVWQSDRLIPQIDLYKIHHFDNKARQTSLKALEIAMRSDSVEDLPIAPGTNLTSDQMDELIRYGEHDVLETLKFLNHSRHLIDFRRSLAMDGDKLNWSDKKIGTEKLVQSLGKDVCYTRINGSREPRQTPRERIALGKLILPNVQFQADEFNRVKSWLERQVITETKGVFDELSATVGGFKFDYGTGGIHGSVERQSYQATSTHAIIDIDVTSLYPSIAIENNLAPEHLQPLFTEVYASLRTERLAHAKGTPENAALKLALNGAYGDSNNKYSPFYDPAFTMAITINGQLQLSMLAERVMQVPTVELIQINTDGLTVRIDRRYESEFFRVCEQWEAVTKLKLEEARYNRMWVRDVNNYLAEDTDAKIKAKGAYMSERQWHQNPSALAVPKAVRTALVHGVDPAAAVQCQTDMFDFMYRGRAQFGDVYSMGETQMPRTFRYFLARDGEPLTVRRPPPKGKRLGDYKKAAEISDADYNALNVTGTWDERIHTKNKSVYDDRLQSVHVGYLVADCSHVDRFDWSRLDYGLYVDNARDLCDLTPV